MPSWPDDSDSSDLRGVCFLVAFSAPAGGYGVGGFKGWAPTVVCKVNAGGKTSAFRAGKSDHGEGTPKKLRARGPHLQRQN